MLISYMKKKEDEEQAASDLVLNFISKKKTIPKEALEVVVTFLLELFLPTAEILLSRATQLSRWCLAGSTTGIFTVLMSISDLKDTYGHFSLKFFLSIQILSMLSGLWFLFNNEIESAIHQSFLKREKEFDEKVETLIQQHGDWRKNDQADNLSFYRKILSILKKALNQALRAKFLFIQIIFLVTGLLALVVDALMNL